VNEEVPEKNNKYKNWCTKVTRETKVSRSQGS